MYILIHVCPSMNDYGTEFIKRTIKVCDTHTGAMKYIENTLEAEIPFIYDKEIYQDAKTTDGIIYLKEEPNFNSPFPTYFEHIILMRSDNCLEEQSLGSAKIAQPLNKTYSHLNRYWG